MCCSTCNTLLTSTIIVALCFEYESKSIPPKYQATCIAGLSIIRYQSCCQLDLQLVESALCKASEIAETSPLGVDRPFSKHRLRILA